MTRILVTGGCGFVGRWVTSMLVERGYDVRIFDNQARPEVLEDILPGLASQVEIRVGDIAQQDEVAAAAKGCQGIIHLAGVLTVAAKRDPLWAAKINYLGSLHVFEAARAEGIQQLSYVSSSGIFGPDDPHHPWPMTHYGAQKLAIEGSARAYFADHGIRSVGFRPYVIYGPGQSSGIAAGPSIAIRAALEGKPCTIEFTGRVGFVHTIDVAALMVEAALTPCQGAEAYTLCGETADMDAFIQAVKRRFPIADISAEGPPLTIPADLASSPMPKNLSAWPVTNLEQGLDQTLAHYRQRGVAGPG